MGGGKLDEGGPVIRGDRQEARGDLQDVEAVIPRRLVRKLVVIKREQGGTQTRGFCKW